MILWLESLTNRIMQGKMIRATIFVMYPFKPQVVNTPYHKSGGV
jgi:hypothetical protein